MSGWAIQSTEIGVIEFRRSLLNIGGVGHSKRLLIGAMSGLYWFHTIFINSNLCRLRGAVLVVHRTPIYVKREGFLRRRSRVLRRLWRAKPSMVSMYFHIGINLVLGGAKCVGEIAEAADCCKGKNYRKE